MTPAERYPVTATIAGEGEVTVDLQSGAPAGLGERVRRILRAAWKHAEEEGAPPPRRIVRWRADR